MFFGEGQGDWRISESDIRHGPSHIFDLTVWPGEFIAIVGESGSGKSTLMNIIGVLDKLTSGEYTLDGVDIHKADDDERQYRIILSAAAAGAVLKPQGGNCAVLPKAQIPQYPAFCRGTSQYFHAFNTFGRYTKMQQNP